MLYPLIVRSRLLPRTPPSYLFLYCTESDFIMPSTFSKTLPLILDSEVNDPKHQDYCMLGTRLGVRLVKNAKGVRAQLRRMYINVDLATNSAVKDENGSPVLNAGYALNMSLYELELLNDKLSALINEVKRAATEDETPVIAAAVHSANGSASNGYTFRNQVVQKAPVKTLINKAYPPPPQPPTKRASFFEPTPVVHQNQASSAHRFIPIHHQGTPWGSSLNLFENMPMRGGQVRDDDEAAPGLFGLEDDRNGWPELSQPRW